MLMNLGGFIFERETAVYQKEQDSSKQNWVTNQRVGQRAAYQNVGVGDEEKTLTGIIYPSQEGSPRSLQEIKDMQESGQPFILVDGRGYVKGEWIILDASQTATYLMDNGTAQKIEFTIKLRKYSDNNVPLENIVDAISV